jgi:hypothetical protein
LTLDPRWYIKSSADDDSVDYIKCHRDNTMRALKLLVRMLSCFPELRSLEIDSSVLEDLIRVLRIHQFYGPGIRYIFTVDIG